MPDGYGVPRAPRAEKRVRRALGQLAEIINGLLDNGDIVPSDGGGWRLRPGLSFHSAEFPAPIYGSDDEGGSMGPPGPAGPPGSAGAAGADASAAAGHPLYNADIPPDVANANDDEFASGVLNTGVWTEWDVGASQTVTVGMYGAKLVSTGVAGDAWAGIYRAVPAGDWSITTKLSLSGTQSNYTQAGIMIAEDLGANPSTADFRVLGLYAQNDSGTGMYVRVTRFSKYDTYVSDLFTSTGGLWREAYLRIRSVAGTISYDYSSNGLAWINLGSEAAPFTIASVGLAASNSQNNGQPDLTGYFRFWRQSSNTALDSPLDGGFATIRGADGQQGPPGVPGDDGETMFGPAGDRGAPGAQGSQGVMGAPLPVFDLEQGEEGMFGPPGDRGATGSAGAAGASGPQGPAGVPFAFPDLQEYPDFVSMPVDLAQIAQYLALVPGRLLGTTLVATEQQTTSTSFTDLGTVQEVSFTLDRTTTVYILGGCVYVNTTTANIVGVTSASFVSPSPSTSDNILSQSTCVAAGNAVVLFGVLTFSLAAGTWKVKQKFRVANASTGQFGQRGLLVIRG